MNETCTLKWHKKEPKTLSIRIPKKEIEKEWSNYRT